MQFRRDASRRCGEMKDTTEEKEHGYESSKQCNACLYEAPGARIDDALHV